MPAERPTLRAMILIAMAGLPASGKSTLARALAKALGAPVFDKDRVRAALFEPSHVEYSREQDDLVLAAIREVVRRGAASARLPLVVLDGRTYSRREQVDELVAFASELGARLEIFECVCSDASARARLAADEGSHPAKNRDFASYSRIRANREPIEREHLVLDTDANSVDELVARCLERIRTNAR